MQLLWMCSLPSLHSFPVVDLRDPQSHVVVSRLEELNVLDLKFLYGTPGAPLHGPTLAVLYQDSKLGRHIKTYEVRLATSSLIHLYFWFFDPFLFGPQHRCGFLPSLRLEILEMGMVTGLVLSFPANPPDF